MIPGTQADSPQEFMDRRLFMHLQGGRQVSGVLRGFDIFLNLVIDQAFEELGGGLRKPCGMIVCLCIC
jgi:small nuclear ribonucleoprotein G